MAANATILQDEEFARHGRLDWRLCRRMLTHVTPYRRPLAGLAVSGAVISAVDVFLPLLTGHLIDAAVAGDEGVGRLPVLGGIYAALVLAFCFVVWWFIVLAGRTATGIDHDLRRDAFGKLQDLSFSYFDVRPTGWLVSRLTSDCSKLASLVPWLMLDLVWGGSLVIGVIIMMLWLHAGLALAVLAIVPPLVIVTAWFQTRLLESSRLMRKTNSMMTAGFSESIMGVRTTKTLVREHENLGEFTTLADEMYDHSMRNSLQSAFYLPLVISLGSAGVGLRSGAVALVGLEESGLTPGVLVAFMQYAALFDMLIEELARRFTELQSAQAAAERVQSLLDTQPEIGDDETVRAAIEAHSATIGVGGAGDAGVDVAPDGGPLRIQTLEFRGVSFWYQEDEIVLEDFSLRVEGGQTVALVGATGGGKSTIVSLAARFYEPQRGEILVNGVDYRTRSLHWLQSRLGVVLQSPHLFAGTIGDNIRYGKLEATAEEIATAARLAGAHEFVAQLDEGFDFEVGEGGSRLSTGQRQLVTLARAVLADPDIFIMDEATSSVDTETERLIQAGIERALDGRIAFVIAHRLSTIRRADVILVVDHGRVVEQGTHDELIARRGRYHALYTRQLTIESANSID